MRRGLSMIEVLAATALLAITAAVCLPLFVGSLRILHEEEERIGADELGLLADAVLDDPEAFGLEMHVLVERGSIEVRVPDRPELVPVRISVVPSAVAGGEGAWFVFSIDGRARRTVACRWVRLPDAAEGGS